MKILIFPNYYEQSQCTTKAIVNTGFGAYPKFRPLN